MPVQTQVSVQPTVVHLYRLYDISHYVCLKAAVYKWARVMLNYTNTMPSENWDTLCIGISHKLMPPRLPKE